MKLFLIFTHHHLITHTNFVCVCVPCTTCTITFPYLYMDEPTKSTWITSAFVQNKYRCYEIPARLSPLKCLSMPFTIIIRRLMNPPAKKNEAYQPTTVEQTANIITHGVRIITHLSLESSLVLICYRHTWDIAAGTAWVTITAYVNIYCRITICPRH